MLLWHLVRINIAQGTSPPAWSKVLLVVQGPLPPPQSERPLLALSRVNSSFLVPHPQSSILNPHSSFFILHSSFLIPHSSFLIPHSSFLIPHSSFLIPHSLFFIHHNARIMF